MHPSQSSNIEKLNRLTEKLRKLMEAYDDIVLEINNFGTECSSDISYAKTTVMTAERRIEDLYCAIGRETVHGK